MKCPSCKGSNLSPSFIEDLFRAHTCCDCGGNWIFIDDYLVWLEHNKEYSFTNNDTFEVDDTKTALFCPVTSAIMQKYRISNHSEHRVDYSPSVGGIWLDSGEWEYLKEHKLAGSLNKLITNEWQKRLRDENAELTFSEIYSERFGEESYKKVKEIREWINNHPNKMDLRAYILAVDPYTVDK